jgi:hypothetical protein
MNEAEEMKKQAKYARALADNVSREIGRTIRRHVNQEVGKKKTTKLHTSHEVVFDQLVAINHALGKLRDLALLLDQTVTNQEIVHACKTTV